MVIQTGMLFHIFAKKLVFAKKKFIAIAKIITSGNFFV